MDSQIAYFDTSAFVPLIIQEPSTPVCRQVWLSARLIVSSRLLFVETCAALAQARRMKRLTSEEHLQALEITKSLLKEIDLIEADRDLVETAADLPARFPLRGYDAVHVASASYFHGQAVMVSGDRQVIQACQGLGLRTINVANQ